MPTSRSMMFALAMLCISIVLLACDVHTEPALPNSPFAIRIVDESNDARFRLSGADLVPTFKDGGAVWLKREGAIEGPLVADAHVGTGVDGSAVVELTLTPEALDQLAALTRANVGRWLAFVVDGKVVVNTLIAGEAPRGPLEMSGDFTKAEASAIADGMMEARRHPLRLVRFWRRTAGF